MQMVLRVGWRISACYCYVNCWGGYGLGLPFELVLALLWPSDTERERECVCVCVCVCVCTRAGGCCGRSPVSLCDAI